MSNWNQEMLKAKMTELAAYNRMNLEALGEKIAEQLKNEKANDKVEDFKKAMQSACSSV